jgi:hypothetical protein
MSKNGKLKNIEGLVENKIEKPLFPPKDIDLIIAFHRTLRNGNIEEIFESLCGEHNNLMWKLECYGENSLYWKNEAESINSFQYKERDAKSKAPSATWLHSKVKCYEHETLIQNTER